MKTLKKIQLKGVSETLSERELKNVTGGRGNVDNIQYCCSLLCIGINNFLDPGALEGLQIGWNTHCSGFEYTSLCPVACDCGCTCNCVDY